MPTTPPPFVFDHVPGFEIATKYKEAIRELYSFGEKSTAELMERYKLGKTTIYHILAYNAPERARPCRTGRPQLLTDARVNEIIEYCAENREQRIMDY
jgi:transposase